MATMFYFISAPRNNYYYKTLYQVGVLGGATRKILADVDSPVAFSPDGARIAYVRLVMKQGKVDLLTNNTEGSDERLISTRKLQELYYPLSRLAWSADGKSIILAARVDPDRSTLVEVPLAGGPEKTLTARNWGFVTDPVWLADHSGLVFAASERGSNSEQLWLLPYPTGEARRITNDPNSYRGVRLSADASMILATQRETTSNLWVAPEGKAELARRITSSDKDYDGIDGPAWTPGGRIVFTSSRAANSDLWITEADGSDTRQLTHGEGLNFSPSVSPDGRIIVFISTRSGTESIWRMDIDGGNPVQLTRNGLELFPKITPDGKDVVYQSRMRQGIFKVPLTGGEPTQLIPDYALQPSVSPNGKFLAIAKERLDPPAHADHGSWSSGFFSTSKKPCCQGLQTFRMKERVSVSCASVQTIVASRHLRLRQRASQVLVASRKSCSLANRIVECNRTREVLYDARNPTVGRSP